MELPWMGLGLSTNLGPRDRPDPWRIHDESPGLVDYVEYSAPLDLAEARREAARFSTLLERRKELPAIFHPVHLNLWGPELEAEEKLEALREHVAAVGSPWVGNDVGWWHHRGAPFPGHLYVAPPLTRAGVEQAASHAAHVQARLPVPLVLENPALLFRNGDLHVLDFLAAVHERTGLPLLLDLGHLLAFQLACGLPADAGLDRFPLDRVVELHIAGGVIGGGRFYYDDHGQPVREELFELLAAILPRCTGLRALTFEADGLPDRIARGILARLRPLVPPRQREPHPPTAAPRPATAPLPEETARIAWSLFERVHGATAEASDDAEGLRAEADFRLAVLAQHLDRDFPLTRALLAGDREGLAAFAASAEYRAVFAQGRELPAAFAAWARRRIREGRAPGAETALAFETWCHGHLARATSAELAPGAVGIAPGHAVGSFPADLSELLFALRSLRRHLADRATVAESYDADALAALAQVARRCPPGPWPVWIHRTDGRLEVAEIDPAMLRLIRAVGAGLPPEHLGPAEREALERGLARGLLRRGRELVKDSRACAEPEGEQTQ